MANNFRITGIGSPYYISKDGNDADTGLTADDPKATLQRYGNNHIIGTGQYKGTFDLNSIIATITYYADRYVKIFLTGDLISSSGNGLSVASMNTQLVGGYFEIEFNGFRFSNNRGQFQGYRTILKDGIWFSPTTGFHEHRLNDSVAVDMVSSNNYMTFFLNNSILLNCDLDTLYSSAHVNSELIDTYADPSTNIRMLTYFATPASQFNNCNYQGQIIIAGTPHELKKDKSGVDIPSRIGNGITDIATIDATVYTRGNFSEDPQFNNIAKRDYWSVASTSPNLFASTTSGSIGNVRAATTITTADSEINTGTIVDLVLDTNDYRVNLPATSGTLTSNPIQIAPISQIIQNIDFSVLKLFDSLEVLGSSENTNVTISDNYTALTAGANPRRLTYEMRWTEQDAEPTLPSEYDNNGYTTAGDFVKLEYFGQPLVDDSGVGNGDPTYDILTPNRLKARWVQIRITVFDGIG